MSLTIGQTAAAADVNIQTIRYYERRGLLAAPQWALWITTAVAVPLVTFPWWSRFILG